jgi:phosphohistidine phosphatase
MIIGHNPGIHEFALQLSGEVANDAAYEARARMKDAFPTAALAVIRFPEAHAWNEIRFGHGSLVSFTKPRDLKS